MNCMFHLAVEYRPLNFNPLCSLPTRMERVHPSPFCASTSIRSRCLSVVSHPVDILFLRSLAEARIYQSFFCSLLSSLPSNKPPLLQAWGLSTRHLNTPNHSLAKMHITLALVTLLSVSGLSAAGPLRHDGAKRPYVVRLVYYLINAD
jgi:hypothetical protein